MDYDLWLRIALAGGRWRALDATLARFRLHAASKTVSESARFLPEVERARTQALASPQLPAHLAGRGRELRRRFHTAVARAYYAELDLPTTRAHLWRAFAADPLHADGPLLGCAAKTLLGTRLVRAARAVKSALRIGRGTTPR
jgi:hypothetical protein